MNVERQGEKIRHRVITVAGNQRAEVWLQRGERISLHTKQPTGGGTSYWSSCAEPDCFGAALEPAKGCFLHASSAQRDEYLSTRAPVGYAIPLQGLRISADVWLAAFQSAMNLWKGGYATMLDCRGAEFDFKLKLRSIECIGAINLQGAVLLDGCEMYKVDFRREFFMSFADFRDGPAYFQSCTVAGECSVDYVHTNQHIAFESCKFDGDVRSEGATTDLRFEACEMPSLLLNNASLNHLSLARTVVAGQIHSVDTEVGAFRAEAMECRASQIGPLKIGNSCDLSHAVFERRVNLVMAGKINLDLSGAVFESGGRLDLDGVRVRLERVSSGGALTVVGNGSASVDGLRNADANKMTFSSLDLSDCLFGGTPDLESISLESTVILKRAPGRWMVKRRCVADEFLWRASKGGFSKKAWSRSNEESLERVKRVNPVATPAAAEVAGIYRALRGSLESKSNQPGAADFYYGEMEMRRHDDRATRGERYILTAYWLLSGYGLRVTRALGCLMLVLALSVLFLKNFGLSGSADFGAALLVALESTVPGVRVDANLTYAGRVVGLILKVVGPALLALAVLAVRNRVRR